MLKLTRRGPIWYLRGTVRGITVYESTKTDQREAAEVLRIKREAELLERSIHGAAATASFVEAAVSYMEAGGERRYLGPLINHFKGMKLAQINQDAIDRAARTLKPLAATSTLNRQIYTPMAAVLNHAAECGLTEFRRIRRPKQPRGQLRWLKPDEAERLIAACAPHLRPLVIFLLYTGCRVSEALYIDWRDIDLARRQAWFIDTKNGEARGVPLHDRVVRGLRELPHREGPVFRRPGKKIGHKLRKAEPYARREGGGGQLSTGFGSAAIRAGFRCQVGVTEDRKPIYRASISPHVLRHTWATWHYAANRDIRQLMELGGWKSEAMVIRYTHVNTEHLRSSINRLPDGADPVQSDRRSA